MSNRRSPAWERLMEGKGLGSYRRVADRAGISHETVRRVILGLPSDDASIQSVADALGVDIELVHEMRGDAPADPRQWDPPESSRLLTDDERAALSRLIGVMTTGRDEQGGGGHADSPAPIGEPADLSDPVTFPEHDERATPGRDRDGRGEGRP